jgi:hypothetical protein
MDRTPDAESAAVRYRIDESYFVVVATLDGDVTFADLCMTQDAILSDPAYRPGMSLLVECRALRSIPSEWEIRKLALDRLLRRRDMAVGRSAIVASDTLGEAYANTWESFADEELQDLRIFSSRDEACGWLGIPPVALGRDSDDARPTSG